MRDFRQATWGGVASAVALLFAAACASAPAPPPVQPGADAAGTTDGAGPPPVAGPALVAALRSKVVVDPITVDDDPYRAWKGRDPPQPAPGTVCGIRFEPDGLHYRLRSFASADAARAAGSAVTHTGPCGTCSTLQDLAVYVERPDLTAPVRRCGMYQLQEDVRACVAALGFSYPCADTWVANIRNTRRACFVTCAWSWLTGEPPTHPDGRLNDCLQCDEDRSGPIFKLTAGRTRRNSGLRSSIPRPAEQVSPVVHDYLPPPAAPR